MSPWSMFFLMHVSIGGCAIALPNRLALSPAAALFGAETHSSPDLIIACSDALQAPIGERRFYADRVWELWSDANVQQIVFRNGQNAIFAAATFNPGWPRSCQVAQTADRDLAALLFDYPLLQLQLMDFLAANQGALLHACGVLDGERLILLVGPPEVGKSTSARLWHAAGATILSDDRLVLRHRQGQLWAYGTPWHSATPLVAPQAAPVAAIFLLAHGAANQATRLDGPTTTRRLLPELYLPLWDAQAVEQVLALADTIVDHIPCYNLNFLPDSSSVAYVRKLLG